MKKTIVISIICGLMIGIIMTQGFKVKDLEETNQALVSENQALTTELDKLEKPEPVQNCPICESSDIEVNFDYGFGFSIICHDCYLHTGWYEDENEARSIWNSLCKKEDI